MTSTQSKQTRIAVIGAGLGGLSAAISLAARGCNVTVYEKRDRVGGRFRRFEKGGYLWDGDPSLITSPNLLKSFWRQAGAGASSVPSLIQLPITCRYRWADGTVIDADESLWNRTDVGRFLEFGGGVYQIASQTHLSETSPSICDLIRLLGTSKAVHLPKIFTKQRLHDLVGQQIADPHLVQLLDHFATLGGSSPYRAPAALAVFPYLVSTFGGWYPEGGTGRIVDAMERLALDSGVEIKTGSEVTGLTVQPTHAGISIEGEWQRCDGVICNLDLIAAHQGLLPRPISKVFRTQYLDRFEISSSRFVLMLGVKKQYPQLSHHNVIFSRDPRREYHEIFRERRPPEDPTITVAVSSRTDPSHAPAGCDNWHVSVNVPSTRSSVNWDAIAKQYGDDLIRRLEASGFDQLRQQIAVREHLTPADYLASYGSYAGNLFGFASHRLTPSFFGPQVEPKIPRFCFAGSAVVPKGGIPLVVQSGQRAASKLLEKIAETARRE
jgi:phytoene desaturase